MKPIIETKFEIFRSFSKIQGNLPFFWELEGAEKLAEMRNDLVWRIGVPLANQIRR
jgi:hypothetical protein